MNRIYCSDKLETLQEYHPEHCYSLYSKNLTRKGSLNHKRNGLLQARKKKKKKLPDVFMYINPPMMQTSTETYYFKNQDGNFSVLLADQCINSGP